MQAALLRSPYNFRMAVTELAEGTDAEHLGELIGLFGIPIVGLILLVVGLLRRTRSRRQAPFPYPVIPPGNPPPGPYPYGYPPPNGPINVGYPNQPGPPAPPPYSPAYPSAPPPYPPAYPSGYPAARPRGSSGTALIVIGSVLLAFGVFGFIGRVLTVTSESERSAHVGQCVDLSSFRDNNFNPPPEDCAKPGALFEVVTKGGSSTNCPDGKVQDSTYAFLRNDTTTLCFMLNFTEGQCYAPTGTPDNPSFAPTDCDGSLPRFRVDKRIDGNADHTLCSAGTKAVSYPDPARLYCLQPLKK
jgi:hypothetical protein